MSLQKTIENDFLAAFKAKNEAAVSTLRMIKTALVNKKIEKLVAKDVDLPDAEAMTVIKSEIKKRHDSVAAYRQGGRADLAQKEQAEIEILEKYLPPQLSEDELGEIVKEALKEAGASGPADFGKVMGQVMAKTKGQADGQVVSKLVKTALSLKSKE